MTRTPLKPGVKSGTPEGWAVPALLVAPRCVNLVTNPVIRHKWGKDREVLRQVEHIRGHLWHIYSIAVNIVSTEIYIYSICRCCSNVATYKWKVLIWHKRSCDNLYILLSLFNTPASNTNPYGPKSGIIPNL